MTSKLLTPVQVGDLALKNRIIMSSLTRSRAGKQHIPNELLAEYYMQRASAGLVMTEATMIAADGCAFTAEAGIWDAERVAGWKQVTDAVHQAGGLMAVQLWHPGRAAHSLLNDGAQPISSSNKAIRNDTIYTSKGAQPYEVPRALRTDELPGIVASFRKAAENAKQAGFDAVEIHGAHGYLLDQFLRDGANDRSDLYGGSIENRARLLFEVVDAAIDVLGAGRVGLRISPLVPYNDMIDSDPKLLVAYVAEQLERRGAAFLDLRHDQYDRPAEQELAKIARTTYHGTLMRNGGFSQASGEAALADGSADAIIYGKLYIANPDLVERFRLGTPLAQLDPKTLYSPGPHGYTDYPVFVGSRAEPAANAVI
ncbi:MAG: nemA 1 [Nevskia sp.]|nr:nemA 1 [Nevskia sp.]